MRLAFTLSAAAIALGVAACASDTAGEGASSSASAAAGLVDSSGRNRANATLSQTGDNVTVRIVANDLSAGTYGAHVHTTGRCDAPDFTTAGPHWNPEGRQHGKQNPQGAHKGDLPNLQVGTDGRGTLEYVIPGATLSGGANPIRDGDGAALVVHASADDYRTDPSGNSGARIACGVIG